VDAWTQEIYVVLRGDISQVAQSEEKTTRRRAIEARTLGNVANAKPRSVPIEGAQGFHWLYFDTVLYDTLALSYLRDVVGADRLMLGSDSPFIEADPMPFVNDMRLSESERRGILGEPQSGCSSFTKARIEFRLAGSSLFAGLSYVPAPYGQPAR
jgi:hypothetical protein